MKKLFTLIIGIAFSVAITCAQEAPPQAFSFKALITKNGSSVANKTVYLQISILQDNINGLAVYVETFTPTTNEYGQVDLQIGRGTAVSGDFPSIEWPKDEYFLKIEYTLKSKDPYHTLSTTQLLSVPYSLYTGEAGNGFATEYTEGEMRPILNLADGSVSIGNPPDWWNKLNVNGILKVTPGTNSFWGSHLTLAASSQEGGLNYNIISLSDGSSEGGGKFLIRNGPEDVTSAFIMDKNGNVGIGLNQAKYNEGLPLTFPEHKLDVLGDINFSGSLLKDGNPFAGDYNALINKPDLSSYATKNMENQNITNLADPVNSQDAATKAYVDALKQQIRGVEDILAANGLLTVSDKDGNTYSTVKIGDQIWITENLKTTLYNDGTSIPLVTDNTTWFNLLTPGYCWYNNSESTYKNAYGALYNWYAVNTNKLCPTGWHVPTDAEWTTLINYLGGSYPAGAKLKETGNTHWTLFNLDATNETGFTALPGGDRYGDTSYPTFGGLFYNIGALGFWWSSNQLSSNQAGNLYMGSTSTNSHASVAGSNKKFGYSVRCLKD